MWNVSGHFVQVVLQSAEQRGLAQDKVLAATEMTASLLESSGQSVREQGFFRLWRYVVDALQDEFLGLTRKPSRPGSFSMACRHAYQSNNLLEFFREVHHVYSLLESDLNIELAYESDTEVVMTVNQSNDDFDIAHFSVESWLLRWQRVACWVTGMNTTPLRAEFSYPEPTYVADYHALFQCPLVFGQQRNALIFEQAFSSQKPIRSLKEMNDFVQEVPANFMRPSDQVGSLHAEIRRMSFDRSHQSLQFPVFEVVAETLNMSPKTLQRKLRREGTSYRKLKETIRRDFVVARLGDVSVPVYDIAYSAGFKESSSLYTVFKKWTGMSPSAYREELFKKAWGVGSADR